MRTAEKRDVTLMARCRICNTNYKMMVTERDVTEYYNGSRRLIQDVFPYLKPAERELLISQTCETCWNKMFGGDE